MSQTNRRYVVIALWVAAGLLAMHGPIVATTAGPHAQHGPSTGVVLDLCVFILVGGGLLAALGAGPRPAWVPPRRRPARHEWTHAPVPLSRRRPFAWCVLRA